MTLFTAQQEKNIIISREKAFSPTPTVSINTIVKCEYRFHIFIFFLPAEQPRCSVSSAFVLGSGSQLKR